MNRQENIYNQIDGFVRTAPEMEIRRKVLDQIVSWSSKDEPVTLGQYVSSKLPERAIELGIDVTQQDEPIKDAHELDDDEMRKVAIARIRQSDNDSVLHKGGKSYTHDDLVREIEQRTFEGADQLRVTRQGISMIESLFTIGKVKKITD